MASLERSGRAKALFLACLVLLLGYERGKLAVTNRPAL